MAFVLGKERQLTANSLPYKNKGTDCRRQQQQRVQHQLQLQFQLRAPRQLLQLAGKRQPHYEVEPEKHIFAFISRQKLCQTHLLAPTSHHHIAASAPCPPATPLPSCCPSWLLGPLFIADFAAQLVCQSFDKVSNCVCGSKSNREMKREGVTQTVLLYRVYSSQVFSTLTQLSGTTSWKSHTLPATNLIISFSW